MAKRIVLALTILTLAAGGAFAQVSIGLGGNFAVSADLVKNSIQEINSTTTTPGGGFYAFFDATYLEVDVGMLFGSTNTVLEGPGAPPAPNASYDGPNVTILTLSLYGKLPISLGSFTLFPMLGIQGDIGLSAKQDDAEVPSDQLADYFNRFWIKLGVGADFNLSEQLYLRPSILYGINFGTKKINEQKGSDVTTFCQGLDIRVALGFRF